MKKIKAIILALALTAFAAGSLWAADPKPQTICPVLGGNVDKTRLCRLPGQTHLLLLQGCDAEFKKDPEKYMKKLKDEGVTLEPAPAGAPKKVKPPG